MDGTACPRGVAKRVKRSPPAAAKADWIVRRKTENLNRSPWGPYDVVVSFSWRYAHVKLEAERHVSFN
jgi:hypothetical protein